jgi:hypothetical protein
MHRDHEPRSGAPVYEPAAICAFDVPGRRSALRLSRGAHRLPRPTFKFLGRGYLQDLDVNHGQEPTPSPLPGGEPATGAANKAPLLGGAGGGFLEFLPCGMLAIAILLFLCPVPVRALEWNSGTNFRSAPISVPVAGKAGFTLVSPLATGIVFTNRLAESRYMTNQIYLNGSGVAAGDFDGDGWCDLYFGGLDGPNVLYRNLGNWKFEDVTASAGVAGSNLDATGAAGADVDGDGDLDLVVNSVIGGTYLFLNDGKGRFSTLNPPLNLNKGGMSLALADIDGDGDLDLYVANYRTVTVRDQPNTRYRINKDAEGKYVVLRVNDRPVTEPDLVGRFSAEFGRVIESGEADVLFRNEGNGRFVPVSFAEGAFLDEDGNSLKTPPYDWGLSVMFRDINGDGAPDIYVCNDFSSVDRIWINTGQGQFRAISRLALRSTSMFSMGVDFADLNRDGLDEIFVADMLSRQHVKRHVQVGEIGQTVLKIGQIDNRPQYSRNTLFLNRGDGTYAEIGQFGRVEASEWSWTPIFLDVDLDGFEDLLITTGHQLEMMNADIAGQAEAMKAAKKMSISELLNLKKLFARLDLPNVAFRNRGDLTFEDTSAAWGFTESNVSHGMALADLDNDGDMDVAVNNLNGAASVYRNDGIAPRVAVRLKGLSPNTQGIGAKIKVWGGPVPQSQEVICGGRYLSGDDPMRVFATGSLTNEMTIQVSWRSGKQSVIKGAKPNRIYEIDEAGSRAPIESSTSNVQESNVSGVEPSRHAPLSRITHQASPLFQDASDLIKHTHVEEEYDDFGRQPLLYNRLSQLGPGVCWHDVDGDGWEDLIIGSGKGGRLGVYRNNQQGGFTPVNEAPVDRLVTRDQTSVLGLGSSILVGSSNYEDGLTNGGWVRIYDLKRKTVEDSILGQESSTGPLAMGDIDGDGDLDLFVGGRSQAGRYPEPAISLMMRNEGGKFVIGQRFEKVGLVSGAVLSDLTGDGNPELILACEWGPVRVFVNEKGTFREMTKEMGLASYVGWWNGVSTGDLDGDGRLDIIASNWGLNSRYRTSREHPRRLYYRDLDGNGTVDLVESYYDDAMKKQVPERGLRSVRGALPSIAERMEGFEVYGKASVEEIYGDKLKGARVLEVNTLSSMVFMNRGGKFEGVELPGESQLAPAFGVSVGDLDGDGNEDVFLSQNFFAVSPDNSRSDGGRGLWLKGDGKGKLEAVSGQESGIRVYGEQRGCALGDYDGDGRVDVVVSQNGAATKLFHNVGAKVGLRVRLNGPEGNPSGVGAQMRLVSGGKPGPAREVHGGSGYWSQESAVQILGTVGEPSQLWIRWPGGKTLTVEIPKGAKEIIVDSRGTSRMTP